MEKPGARSRMRPRSRDNLVVRLERVAQRKLNQPRRSQGAGDFAERRARVDPVGGASVHARGAENCFHVVHRRIAEIGVIPHIKKVRSEPQTLPFRHFEIPDEREIPVLLVRATEYVSTEVAEVRGAKIRVRDNSWIRLIGIAEIGPIKQRRSTEGVQV